MALDMGQLLSIPFILLGAYVIYRAVTRPEVAIIEPKAATKPAPAKNEGKNKKRKVKW